MTAASPLHGELEASGKDWRATQPTHAILKGFRRVPICHTLLPGIKTLGAVKAVVDGQQALEFEGV